MKKAVHAIRRFLETLDATLDYDPYQEIRLRVERLEQQVADLNARMLA